MDGAVAMVSEVTLGQGQIQSPLLLDDAGTALYAMTETKVSDFSYLSVLHFVAHYCLDPPGPKLGPNCLQMVSAANTGRQNVNKFWSKLTINLFIAV